MIEIDSLKGNAFQHFAELDGTAKVSQLFRDLIISRIGLYKSALGKEREFIRQLNEAVKLKTINNSVLYRGLFIQANTIFESFTHDLCRVIINNKLRRITKFSQMPNGFRNNYTEYSSRVLLNVSRGHLQGRRYDFEALMSSLGSCYTDSLDFRIVPDVFTVLMGNVTPERLEKLFAILDFPHPFEPGVGECSLVKNVLNESRAKVAGELAKDKLEEIVKKRNLIVHGDLNIAIEKPDFKESVSFFRSLIQGLCEVSIKQLK